MARITPLFITTETPAGVEVGPVRILAVDKIAAERTCRAQSWPYEDSPRIHLLMGFHAFRRTGNTDAPDFGAFMADDVADFALSRTADDQDDEHPTPADGNSS